MTRVADRVKNSTQLFLDELWKHSDNGKEVVDIDIGELSKISKDYKYVVKAYLVYLQKIGCIDYDYFGNRCLVSVKSKEVVK